MEERKGPDPEDTVPDAPEDNLQVDCSSDSSTCSTTRETTVHSATKKRKRATKTGASLKPTTPPGDLPRFDVGVLPAEIHKNGYSPSLAKLFFHPDENARYLWCLLSRTAHTKVDGVQVVTSSSQSQQQITVLCVLPLTAITLNTPLLYCATEPLCASCA